MNDKEKPNIAAIFDLDGTLYTGHIAHGITRHHQTHRVKRLPLYFYMTTHMAMWPLWRLGLLSDMKVRELWVRHLGWTVRGWTHKEAATAFAWIAAHYVQPLVRYDVMKRVWDHQAVGHRVILVSGTPALLLAEIGRQLGIEETVGTPLLRRAGRYTGACELPVCQGSGKVSRLEAYLGDDSITWSQSYGYADSYTDLPLLERVGHAVAVYPDDELTTHARREGWEIIGDVNRLTTRRGTTR
jgi:HAD superfamily hydrolase (TIGR01490 family)